MSFSLSKFSIHRQMLIGYAPVLIALTILAILSFIYFEQFEEDLLQLQEVNSEDRIFLEIQRDIVELQRNVAVYSYLGYQGIIKKVEFIEQSLEEKFILIEPIIAEEEEEEELEVRVSRMRNHFADYKNGFDNAIIESEALKAISANYIENMSLVQLKSLEEINNAFVQQNNLEEAYAVSQMQNYLLQANSKVVSFQVSPDGILLDEADSLISLIEEKGAQLIMKNSDENATIALRNVMSTLSEHHQQFRDINRINRSYLQLFNVVLAGKAAEIDKLSVELREIIKRKSEVLGVQIQENVRDSKKQFVILSLATGFFGLLSSIFIAMGIVNPVTAMAKTLSTLATGKTGIEIPGLNRNDEVGQMAHSANEFKVMATELKSQTEELEEFSYRTSHDLRSPLLSAIGLLNLADKSARNEKKEETLKIIKIAVSSLTKLDILVKDILDLTKIKNEEEENAEINIDNIIEDALEKLAHVSNFERLSFKVNLDYKGQLQAKKTRIVLVVENLISNAIKYQDLEKDDSFVEISTYQQDGSFVFAVRDNGLGVPKAQQDNVFMMFKRFHSRVSYGSGLGLYMIKKSAIILGGTINYEDTGDGSLFTLVIPIDS